jgi:hypothetical protein
LQASPLEEFLPATLTFGREFSLSAGFPSVQGELWAIVIYVSARIRAGLILASNLMVLKASYPVR